MRSAGLGCDGSAGFLVDQRAEQVLGRATWRIPVVGKSIIGVVNPGVTLTDEDRRRRRGGLIRVYTGQPSALRLEGKSDEAALDILQRDLIELFPAAANSVTDRALARWQFADSPWPPGRAAVAAHPGASCPGSGDGVGPPGLVNAHPRVGVTPLQRGCPDEPLELWLASRLATRRVDPYLDTLVSAAEMLQSGVTTVQHLQGRLFAPSSSWTDTDDAVLQAYQDCGMRVSYSAAVTDQSHLSLVAVDQRLSLMPAEASPLIARYLADVDVPVEAQLETGFHRLLARWDGSADGPIRIQLAPANLHWLSDPAIELVAEAARLSARPMHMHLLETPYQKVYAHQRDDRGAVAHLAGLGILSHLLTIGHGAWLHEQEMALLASAGVNVCHNAGSNLRLRRGIAPEPAMLNHGIRIALGLDQAGING